MHFADLSVDKSARRLPAPLAGARGLQTDGDARRPSAPRSRAPADEPARRNASPAGSGFSADRGASRSGARPQVLAYLASTSLIALTLGAERPAWSKVWARNDVGDRLGELGTDDAGAHGDDLRVVGQRRALGRIGVVGQRGADAGNLVRRDADADAGAADQDRLVVGAVLDRVRHAIGQVRVELLAVVLGRAELGHLVAGLQVLGEGVGEVGAGAVARNCNLHLFLLGRRSGFAGQIAAEARRRMSM